MAHDPTLIFLEEKLKLKKFCFIVAIFGEIFSSRVI